MKALYKVLSAQLRVCARSYANSPEIMGCSVRVKHNGGSIYRNI